MGKKLYKKQSGFVEKTIGDELIIVPLVGAVAQMEKVFSLNELGSFIYNALNEPKLESDILNEILDEFEIDEETAAKDLNEFLNNAVARGIIKVPESKIKYWNDDKTKI